MKKRTCIYVLLLMELCMPVFGQTEIASPYERDAALWTSVAVEKDLSDRLRVKVEEQLRLDRNASSFSQAFTDAGVTWRPSGFVRLSANYRLAFTPFETRHRFYGDLSLRYRSKPLSLTYRLRAQKEYGAPGEIPENYLRSKLQARYDTDRDVMPFVAAEGYYRLWYRGNVWDRLRVSAGIDWQAAKNHEFTLWYMYQKEFNVVAPQQDNIIGVGYTYVLE